MRKPGAVRDLAVVATRGLLTRPLRVILSTLGIAIGIAAMVAVVGISESSRAEVLAEIDALGTNLLTVGPARGAEGDPTAVPSSASAMIARIHGVQHASAVGSVTIDGEPATVHRSDQIPRVETSGLTVLAAQPNLLDAVAGALRKGRFLDSAIDRYPAAVLGMQAAVELGVGLDATPTFVWIGERPVLVVGILQPIGLTPELDRAALIGFPEAAELIGPGGQAPIVTVYVRASPDDTAAVQRVLARTANPLHPNQVSVARPSDALAARAAADRALTSLLVGLGSVALLVGGLGVANVMAIAVLERRAEIGVRRALGASRRDIAAQFLTEALILATIGGCMGAGAGSGVTAAWATHRKWAIALPASTLASGLAAAIAVGAVAGLYPALRAAYLSPTEALRS